ncbi:MAG: hypothetical protein JNM43_18380 [Planctomycetaceae bacterium]|nr:hypothetical protein [Planctomycetaceae bacterium]
MVRKKTEDVVRRATQLYEERLRESLERSNLNDFVAIEPDSGDYFFGKTLTEAIQASRAAHPDRIAFAMRIGHSAAVQIGVMH